MRQNSIWKFSHQRFVMFLCCSVFCVFFGLKPAVSGEDASSIRAAVQSGAVVPLENVLKLVAQNFPGQVINVDLDSESSGWVYKIKVLNDEGRVTKVEYDAKSLKLLKVKGAKRDKNGDR